MVWCIKLAEATDLDDLLFICYHVKCILQKIFGRGIVLTDPSSRSIAFSCACKRLQQFSRHLSSAFTIIQFVLPL